jgi:adenylylsulfate kinase
LKELEQILSESGIEAVTLSLDHIRKVLTPKPEYTDEERALVYRSLVMMAQLLVEQGEKNVIIDATGNRKEFRDLARRLIREFAEVYVKCPLATSKAREASRRGQPVQKGLYKSAAEGKLKGKLPGISAPYEEPENPEVLISSNVLSPHESARKIMAFIRSRWTG